MTNLRPLIALALALGAALPAPAPAQYGIGGRSAYRGSSPAYKGRSKVEAARLAREREEFMRNLPPATTPPEPTMPPERTGVTHDHFLLAPNRNDWNLQHQKPTIYEKFPSRAEQAAKAAEASATSTGTAARSPRPPPSGGSPSQELAGDPALDRLLTMRRRRLVQDRIRELADGGELLDEGTLVREVSVALGRRLTGGPADWAQQGRAIPQALAEPGDLAFFLLGSPQRPSRHVAVWTGDGRFAYASRKGIGQGDIREERWRSRLDEVRRLGR